MTKLAHGVARFDQLDKAEQNFKDAVAGLPNYKRTAVYEYLDLIKQLLEEKSKEIDTLAEDFSHYRAQVNDRG